MRITVILFLLLLHPALNAQDTVRVMHYNLLNYGNYYGSCTSSNNNMDDKNGYLKVLVDFLKPDILTVNEISDNTAHHDYLLDHVFNTNGQDLFKRASLPNLANSPIMNQVFYNSEVFELLGIETVETNYRDIDIITLKHEDQGGGDPVVLRCAVAHLKAGSDPSDAQMRASETYKLMQFLDVHGLGGNLLLCGDLNLYGASESAFQNLLNYAAEDVRFFDPLNMTGEWHANIAYSGIHTQSTHTSGDCFAWGGMDDRFDFILASAGIMEGTMGLKYAPGSLTAVGQDGQRLDQSLVSPANNSVPSGVLSALYAMSDHLPLTMDLVVNANTGDVPGHLSPPLLMFRNPATGMLRVRFREEGIRHARIQVIDLCGRVHWTREGISSDMDDILIPLSSMPAGLYFISLATRNNPPAVHKLVISQ